MKKQILFLLVAILLSTINSYAQSKAVPGSAPRDLDESCEGSPLNPIPGKAYEYSATVVPPGGIAYWWAQFKETEFITDGDLIPGNQEPIDGEFVAAGALNYRNDASSITSPTTTTITWKTGGLAQVDDTNPLFVVLHYTAPATTSCADNLKVYRIRPLMPFQVNVIALGTTTPGYDVEQESCFDIIRSAQYDLANECMVYDYGTNVTQFEVIGAYFDGSYESTFRVDGLQSGQSARIFWSYENTAPDFTTDAPFTTVTTDGSFSGPVVETDEDDTSAGVSIFVWVVVDNGTYEGLTQTPITFAAAGRTQTGVDGSSNPIWAQNVRWDDCEEIVDIDAALTAVNAPDYGIHNLNERPTVLPDTTNVGEFEEPCDGSNP